MNYKHVSVKVNIDAYKGAFNLFNAGGYLPRVGDGIAIDEGCIPLQGRKTLPRLLYVLSVVHYATFIEVEVHYSQGQLELLKVRGINPFS